MIGSILVYSDSDDLKETFRLDTATRSSWLQDPSRISHLISDGTADYYSDFAIEDGKKHRIRFVLDQPLRTDVSVVLHFLSHSESSP